MCPACEVDDIAPIAAAMLAEARAEGVRAARAEISGMLDTFPQQGIHTRARWAVGMLDLIVERAARERGDHA